MGIRHRIEIWNYVRAYTLSDPSLLCPKLDRYQTINWCSRSGLHEEYIDLFGVSWWSDAQELYSEKAGLPSRCPTGKAAVSKPACEQTFQIAVNCLSLPYKNPSRVHWMFEKSFQIEMTIRTHARGNRQWRERRQLQ